MMFNHRDFLTQPVYSLTPAAQMQITLLTLNDLPFVLPELQALHMGRVREQVAAFTPTASISGGILITDGDFHLCVFDAILPDDYQRRTVICIDTELDDVRINSFRASGLLNGDNDGSR